MSKWIKILESKVQCLFGVFLLSLMCLLIVKLAVIQPGAKKHWRFLIGVMWQCPPFWHAKQQNVVYLTIFAARLLTSLLSGIMVGLQFFLRLSLSHFYNTDHRKSNLICVCMSTSPLVNIFFYILPNFWLMWLPWQPFDYFGIAQHPNICSKMSGWLVCIYRTVASSYPRGLHIEVRLALIWWLFQIMKSRVWAD